jgi:hypothetical protein
MLLNLTFARQPRSNHGLEASRSMNSTVRAFRVDDGSSHAPHCSIVRLAVAISIDHICEFVEIPYGQIRAALFWFHEAGMQTDSSLIG